MAASATFGNCPRPRSTVHQQALESQTLSTPDAHEAWMDTVFETHPGKICPGTRGLSVFLLAPSKPNGAEYLHPSLSLYCRHRLIALQSCSKRKALLAAGPRGGSQSPLLPVWGPPVQNAALPPHSSILPVSLSSLYLNLPSCHPTAVTLLQVPTSCCVISIVSYCSLLLLFPSFRSMMLPNFSFQSINL